MHPTAMLSTLTAWLLTYALHSTLLLSGAWLLTRGLRRRSLVLQETIWRCAMLGGLLTASLQLAVAQAGHSPLAGWWALAPRTPAVAAAEPARRVPQASNTASAAAEPTRRLPPAIHAALSAASPPPAAARSVAAAAGGAPAVDADVANGDGAAAAVLSRPAAALPLPATAHPAANLVLPAVARPGAALSPRVATHGASRRLPAIWSAAGIVVAWLTGALLLGAAYLRSALLLRRRLRYRPRVVGGDLLPRLREQGRRAGIGRPVRLSCTWRLRVPVALGGREAEVCLPPRALFQLSDEQQDALLAHELAHLARRDPAWLVAAQMVAALFFFQPLNWVARRHLRELSELLCDEWAVAQTGRPLSLAGCLAEVAAWSLGQRRPALPVPGMADRPSQLAYRIRRLLDGTTLGGRARVRRGALGLALVLLVAVALVAPGISAGSTAAQETPAAAPRAAAAPTPTAAPMPSPAPSPVETPWPVEGPLPATVVAALGEPVAAPAAAGGEGSVPGGVAGGVSGGVEGGVSGGVEGGVSGGVPGGVAAGEPGGVDASPAPPVPGIAPVATPAAAPAPPGERAPDLDVPPASPLADGDDSIAAAAARLAALSKMANLSQEQLAAISKAVDDISREVDSRMLKQLGDLDRQLAGIEVHVPMHMTKDMEHLDADLAKITAHLDISPPDMARLDAELKKLAVEAPRISRQEIERAQAEVRRQLKLHPQGGLKPEEVERIKAETRRAIEESRAALAQAFSADYAKRFADAQRLADQDHPDSKAQLESLRRLETERQDLARLLAKQRADIESMRRDIEREAAAYRDLARRESEAHRLHPRAAKPTKPAPAPRATPAPAPPAGPTPPAAPPAGTAAPSPPPALPPS